MRGLIINLWHFTKQFRIGAFTHVTCSNCEWLGFWE